MGLHHLKKSTTGQLSGRVDSSEIKNVSKKNIRSS
nr:MAG TPA: hypothetical protein [Caudoviricetes sp.]